LLALRQRSGAVDIQWDERVGDNLEADSNVDHPYTRTWSLTEARITDSNRVPPRSDLEENQSAAGGRILRFESQGGKTWQSARKLVRNSSVPQRLGARFKTYLRELIRGDCAPTWVTTESWNRKGC
jgi:hypothetical protein